MVAETPNIDRIGNEGAIFMTYYAEQSCTAGSDVALIGSRRANVAQLQCLNGSLLWPQTQEVASLPRD
jgi:arylsulfatase